MCAEDLELVCQHVLDRPREHRYLIALELHLRVLQYLLKFGLQGLGVLKRLIGYLVADYLCVQ